MKEGLFFMSSKRIAHCSVISNPVPIRVLAKGIIVLAVLILVHVPASFSQAVSGDLSVEEAAIFQKRIAVTPSSQRIGQVVLDVRLPTGCKFLSAGKSRLKIFSKDKKQIASFKVRTLNGRFKLNKKIAADVLFGSIDIYYCQEGAESMCLMKSLLFEVPLTAPAKDSKPNDILLLYEFPQESSP